MIAQASHAQDVSEELGATPDVLFLEAVGWGAAPSKEMLRIAHRRLPRSRLVLVTRGPGKALEEPARFEGVDGLVRYPTRRDELAQLLAELFPVVAFPIETPHVGGAYSEKHPFRALP